MKKVLASSLIMMSAVLCGCASGLNSMQKQEYNMMKANNVLVEEKNTTTAGLLGILPGGGSFYAREPGLGIVNLLFWPASILWDPISGVEGSKAINYYTTKALLREKEAKEISDLDERLVLGEIDNTAYIVEKRKIQDKYKY